MKKIIPMLAALALVTSMPVSAVYAAEQVATAAAAEAADAVTVKDIAGKWMYYVADGGYTVDVCSEYIGFIDADNDGNFTYTPLDIDSPEENGKVKISTEKNSDGTSVPAVFFSTGTDSGDLGGYYHDGIIDIGNGGTARLVRSGYGDPEMDKMIDEKLNGFAFFYNLFQKSGEYDADDTIEVDDCNYEFCRAIDQSVIGSLAELKTLIENTTSGQLKEDMMYCCNRRFREKDGILYVNPVNGSYYPVIPEYGISVTDKTENRFCVIPALRTFGGYYRVVFTETDGEWTISDINSGVFDVNNSVYDHEIAAETKASDLNSILYNLSNGGDPNAEDKITVDGVEYAKADDQVATPAYMENWINRACTGELRDSLLEECRRFIIEKDGVVYREITSKDKWKYGYTNDWMLLSATPDSCRIANANNNELSSYYIIELRKAEGEWRLSRYTIGEFPEERLFFGCVSADADKIDFMEEANIDSRKLFSISKDTRLGIFESGTPGWYKVEYCGCTGYVSADYIKNIDVPEKTVDIGDANEDGKITVSDAVAVLQYIANAEKYALTEQGKKNADCDGEEGITGGDAITIQKIDAGVI